MSRPYKDYQIVSETPKYIPALDSTIHVIQGFYDQYKNERFKPSELPIWNGVNLPGYIAPCRVSDPYPVDCGSQGMVYFIDVSVITVFPDGREPYNIELPRNGWFVCEYEVAKSCGWH